MLARELLCVCVSLTDLSWEYWYTGCWHSKVYYDYWLLDFVMRKGVRKMNIKRIFYYYVFINDMVWNYQREADAVCILAIGDKGLIAGVIRLCSHSLWLPATSILTACYTYSSSSWEWYLPMRYWCHGAALSTCNRDSIAPALTGWHAM